MNKKQFQFFGYGSGFGAGNQDTGVGPDVLFKSEAFYSVCERHEFSNPTMVNAKAAFSQSYPKIHNFFRVLSYLEALRNALSTVDVKKTLPVVIGGDHTQGLGTVAGMKQAAGQDSKLGLIWIDAHLDAHTPQSSPSGNAHGMPLASLMGVGPKQFVTLGGDYPLIEPENLIIIGARSFEPEEAELLGRLGVQIYHTNDVRVRGFSCIFHEALKYLSERTSHFGVSLDLDVFDPHYVPGVGTPEPNGLNPHEVIPELSQFLNFKKASWFEISEFNPHNDHGDKTLSILLDIIDTMATKSSYGTLKVGHPENETRNIRSQSKQAQDRTRGYAL